MTFLSYTVDADGKKTIDNIEDLSLSDIAYAIALNWDKVWFGAVPYLDAMKQIESIEDDYYADTAADVVRYFLANAQTWRGDVARQVKAELKRRLG